MTIRISVLRLRDRRTEVRFTPQDVQGDRYHQLRIFDIKKLMIKSRNLNIERVFETSTSVCFPSTSMQCTILNYFDARRKLLTYLIGHSRMDLGCNIMFELLSNLVQSSLMNHFSFQRSLDFSEFQI